MRPPTDLTERLPEQYFTSLLARVAAAGPDVADLGRGNPDVPPPPHVVEALVDAAREATPAIHGYGPFAGLRELREAIAGRYADVYGVPVDPDTEVAIVPGTKTLLMEFALVAAERGTTILLPDPGYPDYRSAVALAGAVEARVPLLPEAGFAPDLDAAPREGVAALYLNYPSNPTAAAAPDGVFASAVRWARATGAWVLHDFAYADLVFDGRRPSSFLAEEGARDVGAELFSMSKSYGMAGWRIGFLVGNAELVERVTWLQEHLFAGIFVPLQRAAAAALTGPQDTVEQRRALYEERRDRVVAALDGLDARCAGTFFVWFRLPEGASTEELLDRHRVAVAPGEGFGPAGAGWARISLATPDERLDLGLERLRGALQLA